jgi:serine protease Do
MTRGKKPWISAVLFIVIGLITGLAISSRFDFHESGYAEEAAVSKEAIDLLSKTNQAMAEVVAAVKPSVVNIASTKTITGGGAMSSPFFHDPFFRRFFGDDPRFPERQKERKQSGLGSGVIVDKDGYILTNNHVIKGADEIKVTLSDKREFKGKVIGTDQKTDLAVIKIDSDNLPVIRFGDSEKLQVGETVLAIGIPFGLGHTVTSGIVSATGRANVGIADYEDFIQTDAAINPGNSGGALVNIKGELIGINTAIFSTSGGYQGIGFAIPSAMAKNVMQSLIKTGKVTRGWLGVTIQPLTPELSKQFGLGNEKGVLVGDVVEDSPADKAGIQRGDVIVEFDGKEVKDPTHLRNMVAGTVPNTGVSLKVVREGGPQTVQVKIVEMSSEVQTTAKTSSDHLKGVSVQALTPEARESLDIPKRINGVVIADIEDGSPADGILIKNDVIVEINRNRIKDMNEYEKVISKIPSDQNLLILIFRKGSTLYMTLPGK